MNEKGLKVVGTVQLRDWHVPHLGALAGGFIAVGEGNADRDGLDRTNIGEEVRVCGEAYVGAGVHEQFWAAHQESICVGILTGDEPDCSPEGGDCVGLVREDMGDEWVRQGLVRIGG